VPAPPQRPSSVASPPPPPPPSYNTNSAHPPSYGPPTGNTGTNLPPPTSYAGLNTATWGVNYNRQQYPIYAPPPLPVRIPLSCATLAAVILTIHSKASPC
jgi:hypothetical protein